MVKSKASKDINGQKKRQAKKAAKVKRREKRRQVVGKRYIRSRMGFAGSGQKFHYALDDEAIRIINRRSGRFSGKLAEMHEALLKACVALVIVDIEAGKVAKQTVYVVDPTKSILFDVEDLRNRKWLKTASHRHDVTANQFSYFVDDLMLRLDLQAAIKLKNYASAGLVRTEQDKAIYVFNDGAINGEGRCSAAMSESTRRVNAMTMVGMGG